MKIEITLDQSDMDLLRSGVAVAKAVRGGVVTIIYDGTIKPEEELEEKFTEGIW
jgi:hypothetical protein